MKRSALLVLLLAVTIALPSAARSQPVSSPLTFVLEIGRKRAVLAGDIYFTGTAGISPSSPSIFSVATSMSTYVAQLSVASAIPMLSEFVSGKSPSPQSGRVYALAADGAVRALRSFRNVSFTEVRFPVLDAAGKSLGLVSVRFEAEAAKDAEAPSRIEIKAPEDWPSSNFRVQIGDLPITRVFRVGEFAVKRTTSTRTGGTRTQATSSQVEVSNLELSIDMRDYARWQDWIDRYNLQGEDSAVAGTIEILSWDLRTILFRYDLQNVGPVALPSPYRDNNEKIAKFTVELHVGSAQLR